MMHQHSGNDDAQGNRKGLVLKYANRRYDGGSEIDLIRELERKQAIRQLIRLHHMQMEQQRTSLPHLLDDETPSGPGISSGPGFAGGPAFADPHRFMGALPPVPSAIPNVVPLHRPDARPAVAAAPAPVAPPAAKSRPRRVLEALMMGPMQICVGSVGIMTSLLAIFTFQYTNNDSLTAQSKTVLRDCCRAFCKGWVDTLLGPTKAIRQAFSP